MHEIKSSHGVTNSSVASTNAPSDAQYGEVTGVTTSNSRMSSLPPQQEIRVSSTGPESIPKVLGSGPLKASEDNRVDALAARNGYHRMMFQYHGCEQSEVQNTQPKTDQNSINSTAILNTGVTLGSQDERQRQPMLDILSQATGVDIGKNKSKPIPQTIHRFWSGGAMSQEAMHVLLESTEKSKGSEFKHSIWHSSSLEKELMQRGVLPEEEFDKRDTQREILLAHGYEICDIDTLFKPDPKQSVFDRLINRPLPNPEPGVLSKSELNNMVRKACDHLQKGGSDKWDGIKHFSDISRLIYLKEKGGHHFDVDFGLGNMSFEQSYYHNDEDGTVPLLGAITAVSRDPINEHLQVVHPSNKQNLTDQSYLSSVSMVAGRAVEMSVMLNGIIATSAQNPNFIKGIELLRPDIASKNGELPTGMMANRVLIGENAKGSAYTVPPYLIDIEHITAESDSR